MRRTNLEIKIKAIELGLESPDSINNEDIDEQIINELGIDVYSKLNIVELAFLRKEMLDIMLRKE